MDWFRGGSGDDDDQAGPIAVDPTESALQKLENLDRAAEVRDAVVRLEPTRRWTLLLREVEERSYEEIAALPGVPVGTVRSRLARARKLLGGKS